MKRTLILLVVFVSFMVVKAQISEYPSVGTQKSKYATVFSVKVNFLYTAVIIDFRDYVLNASIKSLMVSPDAYIGYISPSSGELVCEKVFAAQRWINSDNTYEEAELGKQYDVLTGFGSPPIYWAMILYFPPLENGTKNISINIGYKGLYWDNINIEETNYVCDWKEAKEKVAKAIEKSNSIYAGMYESLETEWPIAFVESEKKYALLNTSAEQPGWSIGDVWADLKATAYPNIFMGTRHIGNKTEHKIVVTFNDGFMNIKEGNETYQFIRADESPITGIENNYSFQWTGTGFALKDGYIVTNYHVVEDASKIEVFGVAGSFSKAHTAEVVGIDKNSDLALLRINNLNDMDWNNLPYFFKSSIAEVGESVYVLGYPLTQTMGDEIKLTNGIICSKSGFEGDVSTYQISVPVQPGNSGGPMFDMNGNLVGVICAKHMGAENANYAIKTSYLKNLVESVASTSIFPSSRKLENLDLKEQVKQLKNYIFMIKCSK